MMRLLVVGFILVGCTSLLRAQGVPEVPPDSMSPAPAPDAPPVEDNDTTPLHLALLDYKRGKFDEARTEIDAAEKANPGDLNTELLKAKILTEQHDFADGEKLLHGLLTPAGPVEVQMALGDLLLRKRSFDRAAKYYTLALAAKPNDPDITLKLIYCKIGANDLITAGQYSSHLSPLDPKNPYDTHASYYFAKAALAQATGNSQGAEENIQNARTIYGNTVTDRYLKTFLEVFASQDKTANPDLVPPPLIKPAPSGVKQ
jgi:tetratricopeptide (TPR) repeat protein